MARLSLGKTEPKKTQRLDEEGEMAQEARRNR